MHYSIVQKIQNGLAYVRDRGSWQRILIIVLAAGAAFSIVWSFTVGYYRLTPQEIFQAVSASDTSSAEYSVLVRVRIPRVLSAFLVGAALSVSGSAYQGMFRNPLVSPDILGVASGAGLGASLAIFFQLPQAATQVLAFGMALAAAFLSYAVSCRARYGQTVSLVLAGTMMGALCSAATSMLKYLASPDDTLAEITFWLMGSLAKANWRSLMFSVPAFSAGFVLVFMMRWRLNVLTLPDNEAQSVGLHPARTRILAIVAATLLSAGAVCLAGLVGWVGLMIPHVTRGLTGPQFRRLLPACALLGGIFMVLVDDAARSLSVMEIPLGVLTAFLGAPFFLVLILRTRHQEQ